MLSFQPGADIFLPPWQLHVPIPWDKLFFDEYESIRPFRFYTWEEKAKMAQPGSVAGFDHSTGSHRLSLFVASNCEQITRTHWIRTMMDFSSQLVDSSSDCFNNAKLPRYIQNWSWDKRLGPTYGWDSFCEMFVRKTMFCAEHFFYLAFENDINDPLWITEKYIGAFISGSVPVLMGPSDWERRFLPAPHSAIFFDDFPDARALSRFLLDLAANQTAYDEYLAWRSLPLTKLNPTFLSMFDTTRRYRLFNVLSTFAAYADIHPEISRRHRVHVPHIGFVEGDRISQVKYGRESKKN